VEVKEADARRGAASEGHRASGRSVRQAAMNGHGDDGPRVGGQQPGRSR
jgi:hypothetical protein